MALFLAQEKPSVWSPGSGGFLCSEGLGLMRIKRSPRWLPKWLWVWKKEEKSDHWGFLCFCFFFLFCFFCRTGRGITSFLWPELGCVATLTCQGSWERQSSYIFKGNVSATGRCECPHFITEESSGHIK